MRTLCRGTQFARIHTSSLINIEKILDRPFTKFCNSDDVNVVAVELWLIETRPTSFYKKYFLSKSIPPDVNEDLKINCTKKTSICLGYCKVNTCDHKNKPGTRMI